MTQEPSLPETRRGDGSAGDADYGVIGVDYARYRQPEPALAAALRAALGGVRTLVNVGAGVGAGSYEPEHLTVTAVEPSAAMRAQRPAGAVTAVDAVAEDLPFAGSRRPAAHGAALHAVPGPLRGALGRAADGPSGTDRLRGSGAGRRRPLHTRRGLAPENSDRRPVTVSAQHGSRRGSLNGSPPAPGGMIE